MGRDHIRKHGAKSERAAALCHTADLGNSGGCLGVWGSVWLYEEWSRRCYLVLRWSAVGFLGDLQALEESAGASSSLRKLGKFKEVWEWFRGSFEVSRVYGVRWRDMRVI